MKKKKGIEIKINFSKKWFYTLIAIAVLAIIGIGVYAYGTSDPSTFGHSLGEIETCAEGETLQVVDGEWACVTEFLKKKIIEIGDWNMDASSDKNLPHEFGSNLSRIKSVDVLIQADEDVGGELYQIDARSGGGSVSGSVVIDRFDVTLIRATGGLFDYPWFDSTSYNRGWIVIWYEE